MLVLLLAIDDKSQITQNCILRVFLFDVAYCLSLFFALFRFRIFAFIEPAALCLIVLRYAAKAALVRNYLEVDWPRAGGLSAVNAIGSQLRDPSRSTIGRVARMSQIPRFGKG